MTLYPRITNLNLRNQQSVDIFKECPSEPVSREYLQALDTFVNSSLSVKEAFLFAGIIKQLQKLGLLLHVNNDFLDSWLGYWWTLFEREKIREERLEFLCRLIDLQEEKWMIESYISSGFFKRYEQAKDKYRRSLQADKSA